MHKIKIKFITLELHKLGLKLEKRGYIEDCPSELSNHYRKPTKAGIRFINFNYSSRTVTAYTISRQKLINEQNPNS